MATKQMTLRLGDETLHQLNYLMWVARAKSQAEVVRTLVGLVTAAVAAGIDPQADDLFYHGGTVLTAGEQQAYRRVVAALEGLRAPSNAVEG